MAKKTKSRRLIEKMLMDKKCSKQSTLEVVPEAGKAEPAKVIMPKQVKQIEIAEIITKARDDELVLRIVFKLIPSGTFFSSVILGLYFDEQKIDSLRLRALQGPLATDESEFSAVLNMTGISEGKHSLKVEMYEQWPSGEKLAWVSKEVMIEYFPLKREDRLIGVPIIISIVGADLDVVSDAQKNIYREIEEDMKRESEGRRDYW